MTPIDGLARAAVLAMALAAAGTAQAQVKADFAACDGRLKPKKSDDGMRGEAARKGYSQFSSIFGVTGENHSGKIVACSRALEDPRLLPTQTLRRAHLLRERAAAYLASGKPAEALADLDAAEAAVAARKGEPFYERSMGVSLALLRAIGLAQQGQTAEAARLAAEAAAVRPFALEVQAVAAVIRQAARPIRGGAGEGPGEGPSEGAVSPFENLVRIEPAAARGAISAETSVGNFAGVVALSRTRPFAWPEEDKGIAGAIVDRNGTPRALAGGVYPALDLAYAHAATGDTAAARVLVGEVRGRLTAFFDARAAAGKPVGEEATGARETLVEAIAGPQLRLVEARIALAEGEVEGEVEGAAKAGNGRLPFTAAAIEYFTALRAAAKARGLAVTAPDPAPLAEKLTGERKIALGRLADTVLIAPETPRSVIDYKKSRPNILGALVGGALSMGTSLLGGIERTAGFRSTPNADGTVKVEFTGSTTSGPMVQEMTLLRAAELAQAAGKRRFAVIERKDYTRWMVATQYGAEISRTPAGYKSELVVRFDDADAAPAATLDAVAVIDALGPLYYGA